MNIDLLSLKVLDVQMRSDNYKNVKVLFDVETQEEKANSIYCVEMHALIISESESELKLRLQFSGRFQLSDLNEGDNIEKILRTNCCAIMYPFLREKVATLTAMTGSEPYYLPSANFFAMYDEWLENQKNK